MLEWRSLAACNTNNPAEEEGERCMQRVEEWARKIKNDKVRNGGRDSVCDSTKTALRFHHSRKRYC